MHVIPSTWDRSKTWTGRGQARPCANVAILPLFPERANFQLKGPGAARLLVELPVGRRDRGRRHQQIRIVERFLAPELLAPLAHPGGIDAGIDDQMRDMDVLRARARAPSPAPPRAGRIWRWRRRQSRCRRASEAVAPVKKMLPWPRGSISRADSRPARKPAQHAISQTLRNTRSVVSRIGKLTLAPTLKIVTSSGACLSASLRKAATSSSFRASSDARRRSIRRRLRSPSPAARACRHCAGRRTR